MTTHSGKRLSETIEDYLSSISMSRSENTFRTYRNALNVYKLVLEDYGLTADKFPAEDLPEDSIAWFARFLKEKSPATERLYLCAVTGLFNYLAAEKIGSPNLPRIRLLIQQRARRPGKRLPQFPRSEIEKLIDYAINIADKSVEDKSHRLINMRDRAFLITLADTGLRVHEACGLRRGDIDWNESKAIIIGKGDRQDIVRFSKRAIRVLREYLKSRSKLDGSSGRPLASLALFARHDRGAGRKVKPISTTTGRNIVARHVKLCLGPEAVGTITPHSFRHYFVTTVLRASGGNIKLAQELARHRNISVTQRYAHLSDDELDRGYHKVFEKQ